MRTNPFWSFITPILVLIIFSTLFLGWTIPIMIKKNAEREALNSAQNTANQFKVLRAYYTKNVIKKILNKGILKPASDHKDDPDKIPLPATMIHDLSSQMTKTGNSLKLYSKFPFPNRVSRQLDDFGEQAWIQLNTDVSSTFSRTEVINGKSIVRVGIADLMVADACVNCHNTHPETPKDDWKLGDIRGVLEVSVPIETQLEWAQQLSYKLIIIMMMAVVIICISMYFIYNRTIGYRLRSDQKIAEKATDALRKHKVSLEQTIHERTNELVIAKEQAESANKEKSRFLANISHELRTPMHAILSFSNLAIKRVTDEKTEKFLQNIRTSGIRLTGLLNDLLDLAKLESGKMTAEFSKQNITAVANNCITELSSLIADKELSVQLNTNDPVMGMFDQNLIGHVITNILSNAIKFSLEGEEINITIESSTKELNGKKQQILEFVVKDKGVGVPPSELKSVFDPFTQSTKTRNVAGGTGLGLPICNKIINLHNGKIWVESPIGEEGIGSAFYFRIPAVQSE